MFICFIIPDLLVIIAAISMIALMTCSYLLRRSIIRAGIDDTREQMDGVMEELSAVLMESGLDSIPEQYRTEECLNYLHGALLNQTAFTIPQAVYYYELAEQNKRQLEIQEQQLREIKALRKKLEELNGTRALAITGPGCGRKPRSQARAAVAGGECGTTN